MQSHCDEYHQKRRLCIGPVGILQDLEENKLLNWIIGLVQAYTVIQYRLLLERISLLELPRHCCHRLRLLRREQTLKSSRTLILVRRTEFFQSTQQAIYDTLT